MVSDNGAKVFSIKTLKPFSSGGREPDPSGGSTVGGGGGGGGVENFNPGNVISCILSIEFAPKFMLTILVFEINKVTILVFEIKDGKMHKK
jgi:hypothetical protein